MRAVLEMERSGGEGGPGGEWLSVGSGMYVKSVSMLRVGEDKGCGVVGYIAQVEAETSMKTGGSLEEERI
jgi:hypothetical protein